MQRSLHRSAYMVSRDSFCDGIMQSLLLNGAAPQPIRMESRIGAFSRRSWRDSGRLCALHEFRPGWSQVKRLSMAARHARFARKLRDEQIDILFLWRGLLGRAGLASLAAQSAGLPCIYFERGPLPGWIQIDRMGVNARSSIPRDPEFFARWRRLPAPFAIGAISRKAWLPAHHAGTGWRNMPARNGATKAPSCSARFS